MMDKFKIVWRPEAQQDLIAHVTFLSNINVEAALKLKETFFEEVYSLMNFPERNSVFDMPDGFPFVTRKKVVNKRYLIIFTVKEDSVKIYRVLDSRKQFEHLV